MPSLSTSRCVTRRTRRGAIARHQHALVRACRSTSAGRIRLGVRQVEHDHVGLDVGRVDDARRGIGDAGREPLRVLVVLGEPLEVVAAGRSGPRRRAPRPDASRRRAGAGCHGPASAIAASFMTTTDPTGAPRPLLRQTDIVSNSAPYPSSPTPVATWAFQIRAPSQCSAGRVRCGQGAQRSSSVERIDRPAAAVVGLLDRDRRRSVRRGSPASAAAARATSGVSRPRSTTMRAGLDAAVRRERRRPRS